MKGGSKKSAPSYLHYLRIDDPDAFTIMIGLASMGSSIPGAVGVKVGRPRRTVAAIVTGDRRPELPRSRDDRVRRVNDARSCQRRGYA